MTQLLMPFVEPKHPFLRGVDPSEPFDLMAYCVEIGKAHYRIQEARRAELEVSARYAEAVMAAVHSGNPIPPKPVLLQVAPVKKARACGKGMTQRVLALLIEHGPMTAKQLRARLDHYKIVPLLHQLARYKRVVREGRKGSPSATWRALT